MPGITIDLGEFDGLEDDLGHMADKVLGQLEGDTGLLIREAMSTVAKNMAPTNKRKGGGTLKQLIDTEDDGFSVRHGDSVHIGITSHADYSIYVEWGTGYKGDPRVPHTPKKHWVYYDKADQQFYPGVPIEARHFMEPALYDNVDNICEIIAGNIQEVFEL